MKAALDQRTLTNTESEPEKSHHIQHHHYPGRGYQLLQSTVSREINVQTPVLQEIVRSQDRPQQHCLFALAIEWAPATAEPRALTVKAAEPLQYPTTLTFSSKWQWTKKVDFQSQSSLASAAVQATSIPSCLSLQGKPPKEGRHSPVMLSKQLSGNTSIAATISTMPKKLLI